MEDNIKDKLNSEVEAASEAAEFTEEEAEEKIRPQLQDLESELSRERYRRRYRMVLQSTIFSLITVAAVSVLVATLWMPVLQIYGSSMEPTLASGEVVLSHKTSDMHTGDVIAFYYNNKILVKRVIGSSGDWIDIDDDGNVYLNGTLIDEPYVSEKAMGECNIDLPYQVPDNRVFVLGDHRSVSVDSRNTAVGCVADEQIVGKLTFRIWPMKEFGFIK